MGLESGQSQPTMIIRDNNKFISEFNNTPVHDYVDRMPKYSDNKPKDSGMVLNLQKVFDMKK